MDVNKDGVHVISKSEHRRLFDAWKNDATGAIIAFREIDENMDGAITRDKFVKAGTEFFLNFTDEAKLMQQVFLWSTQVLIHGTWLIIASRLEVFQELISCIPISSIS